MAWAAIGDSDRDWLNIALNEATWTGIEVDLAARQARLQFDVLSLPTEDAPGPGSRVIVAVSQVSRIAASLRAGRWNDQAAEVIPLDLAGLDSAVRSFGGCAVYGWEFIDPPEKSWEHWRDRLSLDARLDDHQAPHVIDLFQEGGGTARHLDLRIWFSLIQVTAPGGGNIALSDFTAAGIRWWDGMYAGDPRTSGHGITPLSSE